MDLSGLEKKPITDWTDQELKLAASYALPSNLSPGDLQDHYWLRICGLDALRTSRKELRRVTEEDFAWWKGEKAKKGIWDPKLDKKILFEVGREESKQYMRDCLKKEKQAIEEYIETNWDFLWKYYPIYINSWFSYWGSVHQDYEGDPDILEWSIFFSLLTPRPPSDPYIKLPLIINRFFTIQKETYRPQFLKYIWETKELREKVLRGEPLPYQWELYAPYSTVYSYITRAQEEEDRRKEVGRSIDRSRNKRWRGLNSLFKQVEQAQKEGKEVIFTQK